VSLIAKVVQGDQAGSSGHNDPTPQIFAQTIVMLAKQGERDPIRLEQRALEIISRHAHLARSTSKAEEAEPAHSLAGKAPL